jgi:hypothetical protein
MALTQAKPATDRLEPLKYIHIGLMLAQLTGAAT